MGVKESFTGSSILTKVTFTLLFLAQICSWIAFTVPQWGRIFKNRKLRVTYDGYGIWRTCTYNGEYSGPSQCSPLDGSALDWFAAVQAMAIFGFVGINIAFLIVVLQMFTSKCKGVNDIGVINAIQCIVTAVLYLIGVIIFAVKFDSGYFGLTLPGIKIEDPGELAFGFGLAIVAIILAIVSGVLMIVENKKGSGTSPA